MSSNYLTFSELDEQDYQVVALRTVLQDYKLAYLLNKKLSFNFNRIVPDLDFVIENQKAIFSSFEYEDSRELITWYLVKNKFKTKAIKSEDLGLFQKDEDFISSYVYLQPEHKEADFIIKIQGDFLDIKLKNILKKINNIEGITTAYSVDITKLKYKEYLIF